MRRIRGSRPERVCIRVSKHTFWIRCRDRTHQARRVMNRRIGGSTVTAVADNFDIPDRSGLLDDVYARVG